MNKFLEFFLTFLSQFAGGPGPMEHNLVRFSIPVVFYGGLMVIAWSRQRDQDLPREKLLVWGFGLGAGSALVMTIFVALQMLDAINRESAYAIMVPMERALMMAAVIVIAAAFLRYILDDARLTRIYLQIGLGVTAISLIIALWQWPRYLATLTESRFHTTMVSALFQICTSILIVTAIVLLRRQRNWLSNVVTVALSFILMGELLFLANYATDKNYNQIICPIGNFFPIMAIPLLGYVYLKEQGIEKKQAQDALDVHRHHLEELVVKRTTEIAKVNTQLQDEVNERKKAEDAFAQLSHQYELILESAGEGICGIDRDGRFSFVNAAAARMLGYEVKELVGQPSHEILHSSQIAGYPDSEDECPICAGYKNGVPNRGEDRFFSRKDKTSFPVSFVSNPAYEGDVLTGAAVVFKDISKRKQAEAEIARRNTSLAAQNTIADALGRSLDLTTILDTSLDAVLSIVDMEAGLIFLWDSGLDELILKSYRGSVFQDKAITPHKEWSCCGMISTEAMKNYDAVVKQVSECPAAHASPMIIREGLETLVSVPLVSNGKALGALTLASRKSEPIQPPELELLTIIGQQIGMAVENSHLYHASERVAEELTLLHQISTILAATFNTNEIYEQIVLQSVNLLDCQIVCILDWNEESQAVSLLASHGINESELDFIQTPTDEFNCLRDLVSCRESIVIGDTGTDSRVPPSWAEKLGLHALLCVPIRSMSESFGALFLLSPQSGKRWQYEEVVLIESFVNRAAVALMNANLHKQLEWTAALEERQRIAADMHDSLAQTVSLLGLQIDEAMELISKGSGQEAVDGLSMTRETVKQVSADVRRSIASLQRTPQPRRSFQDLLADLPKQLSIESVNLINFAFKVQEPLFLPQDQGNQALFVIQEALLNAYRHAKAQHIEIALEQQERKIIITVKDNGIGFELGEWWQNSRDHFGLGIMHSRAANIGANLLINSSPGEGTQVTLTMHLMDTNRREKVSAAWNTTQLPSVDQGIKI